MYQMLISGPKSLRLLRWDPRKLEEHDPRTIATLAEADRLLKEAYHQSKSTCGDPPRITQIAASGRWVT